MRKKEADKIVFNPALSNIITPINGIEFRSNSLEIGENHAKIYGIIKYPTTVELGWLAKISNIPGTVICFAFEPIDSTELIEAISRNVTQNRGIAESTSDPLTRQRAEKGAEDGERIMKQIDQNGESVGQLVSLIMPLSSDKALFQKICRKSESVIAALRCKIRGMANLQKQAFRTISPYYPTDEKISNIIKRIVPLSTFTGGFPFSSSGYNDGEGFYFAKDSNGGLVIIDSWLRGGDRTNTNWVIMGVPGIGKSTVVKHLILSEYMKGTKILAIDPERELKELCKKLNGDWINVGGSSNGMINPLQIRPVPNDEEDENEKLFEKENGMGDMALHMKTLDIFFSLYLPSLNDIQKALLKETLEELYKNFGILWDTDTSKLKNSNFPVFADLYKLLLKKSKAKEKALRQSEENNYELLASLFRDIAIGSDRFLWNGHTSIEYQSRIVVLDTHDLQNASETIKKTQYFNVLTWCWEQMSFNRNEKTLLICDEGYLLIDPQVPQSLVFLRNAVKRARKYEAGIAIVSHSVVDFIAPEIKTYGQALLDSSCFKVLMGTDGRNLKETAELLSLTEAEQDLLFARKRGHGLFLVGSKRAHVIFEIPEYEFEYIGTAGGR